MSSQILILHQHLDQLANPKQAILQKRFFKTSTDGYAANEQFIGISVPVLRGLVKPYQDIQFNDLNGLLQSPINEKRLLALFILVNRYEQAGKHKKFEEQKEVFQFFIDNRHHVNNWNLVDSSAPYIVGAYLWDKNRNLLTTLSASKNMWERRIAIVATWFFIRKNDLKWTLKLAKLLFNDTQDLIHKATGWMLRELGKKDQFVLIDFLNTYAAHMPRTMLRAAIEKFPESVRKSYLKKQSKILADFDG